MNNIIQKHNETSQNDDKNNYLYFVVGNKGYAVPVGYVLEVMKLPYIECPENLKNNVIGLLNYNNLNINILDIRLYLDLIIKPYNVSNQLILFKTDESIFGIVVDTVENIISISNKELNSKTKSTQNPLIKAESFNDGLFVEILDIEVLEYYMHHFEKNTNIDINSLYPTDDESRYKLQKRTNNLADKSKYDLLKDILSKDKYLSFNLNEEKYCIDLAYVKEVLKNPAITQIPCAPEHVLGILSLRGDFITVVDLKSIMGLPTDTTYKTEKIIVIQSDVYKMGFTVDEIFKIREISEDLFTPKDYEMPKYILNQIENKDEETVSVIDMKRLLSDERFFIEEK